MDASDLLACLASRLSCPFGLPSLSVDKYLFITNFYEVCLPGLVLARPRVEERRWCRPTQCTARMLNQSGTKHARGTIEIGEDGNGANQSCAGVPGTLGRGLLLVWMGWFLKRPLVLWGWDALSSVPTGRPVGTFAPQGKLKAKLSSWAVRAKEGYTFC